MYPSLEESQDAKNEVHEQALKLKENVQLDSNVSSTEKRLENLRVEKISNVVEQFTPGLERDKLKF